MELGHCVVADHNARLVALGLKRLGGRHTAVELALLHHGIGVSAGRHDDVMLNGIVVGVIVRNVIDFSD
jgi:hypothetical protein